MTQQYNVEICNWNEKIQKLLYEANPELFKLIEGGVSKSDEFMLASYDFADNVLSGGNFHLPAPNVGTAPYLPEKSSPAIREFFGNNYVILPFGVVLNGYVEVYWNAEDKIVPRGGLEAGVMFGVRALALETKKFNFQNAWNITSGSRAIALIPSMRDIEKFRKLKRNHEIHSLLPQGFHDHFKILRELYDNEKAPWKSTMLFFSQKLIAKISSHNKFQGFREYLYKWVLDSMCFDRNRTSFEFIWEEFIRYLENKGIKEKGYIYNLAKHLIIVALGEEFAFASTTDNKFAPIDYFQKIFINDYKMKYFPSFINAVKFDKDAINPAVYYSLQYPIHLNPFPAKHAAASGIDDIRSIKEMHQRFFEYIDSDKGLCARESIVSELKDTIQFKYFHTVQDGLRLLSMSKEITEIDPRFIQGNVQNKPFCHASSFFKGCIAIDKI